MKKDFFISYTGSDRQWAEWIAWQLESSGYKTVLQAWDFHAGGNFILEMHRAAKETDRTIAVLSSRYLESLYAQPEWAAALVQDPAGSKRLLIPIRIEDVQPDGLLAPLIYIDLAGLSESVAKDRLLKEIRQTLSSDSARPETAPDFPSSALPSMKNEPRFPGTLPPVWNLPRRNPHFTGRVQLLEDIRESLNKEHNTALTQQALYGLGGIGKTQLAMEYAWQQSASYDLVWLLRAEASSSLIADYIALANELQLPESNESEQELVVRAMLKWLDKHQGWLLIFDNAKDAKSIRDYLPESSGGHVLITSRNQDWRAFGKPLSIEVWNRNEAIAFLQKRTGQSDENVADKLAEALGDLPLALEQAAAYIETRTKTYAEYLDLFNFRRKELWDREAPPDGYFYTISTTWSLAFDEIKSVPMAKELLSLCSMAAPDTIPKSLLDKALVHYEQEAEARVVIDSFTLDDAVAALRSYSLITPDTEKVSTHRLVQAVVRDRMSTDELARYRDAMIEALSDQFPDKAYENPSCWPECASLLPHAQALLDEAHHDQDGCWLKRALLLNNVGEYHHGRAAYADAEFLFHRALEIREEQLGLDHIDVAYSLNNLAVVLEAKGRYAEAEPLYYSALGIREEKLGTDHPDVATSLDNLASLLHERKKFTEAKSLYRRALRIMEKTLGKNHPSTVTVRKHCARLHIK
jgi:TIR domain/Tetratricopeptide repeat/NB-ARC domain